MKAPEEERHPRGTGWQVGLREGWLELAVRCHCYDEQVSLGATRPGAPPAAPGWVQGAAG